MIEVLNFIEKELNKLNIPYEFMTWTAPVSYPYFVGEFSEFEPTSEDGQEDKTLLLTGTTRNSWLELIEVQEKLKKHFPIVEGMTATLEDGSAVAVFYSSALPVPTGEEELKRLQINLTIKLWKVE